MDRLYFKGKTPLVVARTVTREENVGCIVPTRAKGYKITFCRVSILDTFTVDMK